MFSQVDIGINAVSIRRGLSNCTLFLVSIQVMAIVVVVGIGRAVSFCQILKALSLYHSRQWI